MLLFSLALAVFGGGLSAIAARRTIRPVLSVTDALDRAGHGRIAAIPLAALPAAGTEARQLALAFNAMVAHVAEREHLERQLARREQAATLGRLAATVAHEVRNPLAGIATALEVIRRFGDDRAERGEALDLLGRGLEQIERVVSSTLTLHRDHGTGRPLGAADLDDLRVLVEPQAKARGVRLCWRVRLPGGFAVDAAPLRQAVLNLLLNAVAASPVGAVVSLRARTVAGGNLLVMVRNHGPGLPEGVRALLMAERPTGAAGDHAAPGLGLEVVATIARSLAARLIVAGGAGGGTRISLLVPPDAAGTARMGPEDRAA
jgi:signal transduction histidine kinase